MSQFLSFKITSLVCLSLEIFPNCRQLMLRSVLQFDQSRACTSNLSFRSLSLSPLLAVIIHKYSILTSSVIIAFYQPDIYEMESCFKILFNLTLNVNKSLCTLHKEARMVSFLFLFHISTTHSIDLTRKKY